MSRVDVENSTRFRSSSSGVSSWMSNNQPSSTASSNVGGLATAGRAAEGIVPESAASIEKGSPLLEVFVPELKAGGSTLVKGELDTLRRDRMPKRLLLGERPATDVEGTLLAGGMESRVVLATALLVVTGLDSVCFKTNFEGPRDFLAPESRVLAFLEGEYELGSMFSESTLVSSSRGRARLTGVDGASGNAKGY